jgi:hypothetical protein
MSFFHRFIFLSSSFNIGFIEDQTYFLFVLLSITITRPRSPGHTFVMLARIDLKLLHCFILFYFM